LWWLFRQIGIWDGLLFLQVVVGRGQKTNGADSFVLTIPMSHLRRKLCLIGMVSTTESVGGILYPCPITTLNCEPSLPPSQ